MPASLEEIAAQSAADATDESQVDETTPASDTEPQETEESAAFVVDSYVLLRYVEIESAIHKALLVLKMRGSDHAKDIRQFQILSTGIDVQAPFEGQEGILSGSPRRSMAESFVDAFIRK